MSNENRLRRASSRPPLVEERTRPIRRKRSVLRAYLLAAAATSGGAVPAPTVAGPRTTTSDHPVYRFSETVLV